MLLKIKNLNLYNAWIEYYAKSDLPLYAQRTYAFFNSQNGLRVPL